jgi:hypothetical protein
MGIAPIVVILKKNILPLWMLLVSKVGCKKSDTRLQDEHYNNKIKKDIQSKKI